ncbi:MAG TPA: cupin domain-containing protein [Terriglobales bacterium]|nr:cupin domain-containing protein [Terriglobales bacterium]
MRVFAINDLLAARSRSSKPYSEFLRVPALSAGMYVLAAGAEDKQQPHSEDEMYYVISGSGRFRTEQDSVSQDVPVAAGSVIFIEAGAKHGFHMITEELTVLVFFAPAERM